MEVSLFDRIDKNSPNQGRPKYAMSDKGAKEEDQYMDESLLKGGDLFEGAVSEDDQRDHK
jgi:hypothetical protein